MRKKICYLGALAAVLASCTVKEPLSPEAPVVNPVAKADPVLLDFGAYVNRGIATKAGAVGELNSSNITASEVDGFGVFAYYNNGELYNEMAKPDFMYNQHITYDGANWTYSPLRYWPNEFGSSAVSEEVDRLTFFAYAPWAQVTPTTGVVIEDDATGIIGMSRNTATGDPLVKYAVNYKPGAGVDLCWGVVAEDFSDVVDGGTQSTLKAGKPWLNVVKPTVGSKIKFDFKHALASLNVQIDADIDDDTHAHDKALDDYTRIYVRSVTFEGFTTKGALNLNSEYEAGSSPTWFDLAGTSKLATDPITIYDGRRDGKEGVETGEAKNEKPADLNPQITQSKKYTVTYDANTPLIYGGNMSDSSEPGVINTPQNLFNANTLGAPVYVIPTDEELKITIVYDVETADPTLSGYLSDGETHGVSVENAISNTITLASGGNLKLVAGKKYIVKLHLGMTSVKFDAQITEWGDGETADTDLPYNTEYSVADNQSLNIEWPETVSYKESEITIPLRGLTKGKKISVSVDPADAATATYEVSSNNGTVGDDRKATIKLSFAKRGAMDQAERPVTVSIKQLNDDDSEYQTTTASFTQEGHPEVVFDVVNAYSTGHPSVDAYEWPETIPASGATVSFKVKGFVTAKDVVFDTTQEFAGISSWSAVMSEPSISKESDGTATISFTIKPRTAGAANEISFAPVFAQKTASNNPYRSVSVKFTQAAE